MARHPWEITLREFVKMAKREYGAEVDLETAAVAGSIQANRKETEDRIYPVLMMDPDAVMPVSVLRYLCEFFGLPPEDFGLEPEENED